MNLRLKKDFKGCKYLEKGGYCTLRNESHALWCLAKMKCLGLSLRLFEYKEECPLYQNRKITLIDFLEEFGMNDDCNKKKNEKI